MQETEISNNENSRRIRAAVRALMSPGVWLVASYHGMLLILLRLDISPATKEGTGLIRPVLVTFLFLGLVFLAGGTYRSFAADKNVVSVPQVIRNGMQVFSSFLWLSIKAGLLGLLVTNILVIILKMFTQMEVEAVIKAYAGLLPPLVAIFALVFVYWLPVVFVGGNYRLLETLVMALRIARNRIAQSGYIAVLILGPALVLWWLPQDIPDAVAISISVVGELLTWIAFVYCVDYLVDSHYRQVS